MSCLAIILSIFATSVSNSYIAIYPIVLTDLGVDQRWICLLFLAAFFAGIAAILTFKKKIKQFRPYRMRIATYVLFVIA